MNEDSLKDSSIVDLYKEQWSDKVYYEIFYKNKEKEAEALDWEFLLKMYNEYFSQAHAHQGKGSNPKVLDFGCGPVPIYAATAVATSYSKSITFADLVENNRTAITNWMQKKPDAFNWDKQFNLIANLNDKTESDIQSDLRLAFVEVVFGDIKNSMPISGKENYFDVIMTNMCLQYACIGIDSMKQGIKNLGNLLKPGGIILEGGDLQWSYVPIENVTYPSTYLTKENIKDIYKDPDMGMQLLVLKYKVNRTSKYLYGEYFLVAQKMDKDTPIKVLIEEEIEGFDFKPVS